MLNYLVVNESFGNYWTTIFCWEFVCVFVYLCQYMSVRCSLLLFAASHCLIDCTQTRTIRSNMFVSTRSFIRSFVVVCNDSVCECVVGIYVRMGMCIGMCVCVPIHTSLFRVCGLSVSFIYNFVFYFHIQPVVFMLSAEIVCYAFAVET